MYILLFINSEKNHEGSSIKFTNPNILKSLTTVYIFYVFSYLIRSNKHYYINFLWTSLLFWVLFSYELPSFTRDFSEFKNVILLFLLHKIRPGLLF